VDGNILALSVHGNDSRSVVDEMLVGGRVSAARLSRVIRRRLRSAGPDAVQVVVADPHELVDPPTRALDLLTRTRTAGDVARGLAELLHADAVETTPDGTGPEPGDGHALVLPCPDGAGLIARRAWAPFTVTERARAEAFLRAASTQPARDGHELLLPGGEELTVLPAAGPETTELDTLLRTCLAGASGDGTAVADWTVDELRSVLDPPGGVCLLVRTTGGTLVAAGSLLAADGGGPEPVVLVHPLYRGRGLAAWLRRRLGTTVAA